MDPLVTLFEPQPSRGELPNALPSPFDAVGPHPLARRAAEALVSELRAGGSGPRGEGKMLGVLVVRTPGGIGFLRAFSGMIDGGWTLPGFVPPVFDEGTRRGLELPGERTVSALDDRTRAFERSPELLRLRAERDALEQAHTEERAELRARHLESKRSRQVRRAALSATQGDPDVGALHAIDQESRRDKAELRRCVARQEEARRQIGLRLRRLERRLKAHERLRAHVSRRLMQAIHDTYVIRNARGEQRSLRSLYAGEPPSGAADCAGPKLFAAAYARGFEPLALAELWWGPPPSTGGRVAEAYYPACSEKCGPLLPFMLEGLEVAPPRKFVAPTVPDSPLRVVFRDDWLLVIDKPAGILSVPGKDDTARSILEQLRACCPDAKGPLLVHRLDLDTSGLLVACLDARTHAAVQKQFIDRTVEKQYVALLDGVVRGERGTIELAIRGDPHDRPRQIHDPVHGKRAITDWEIAERQETTTRMHLFPRTGRTHQLRVHAAHPHGLGVPILGDRLYGRAADRLHLHAARLVLRHPATGERLTFESPAPF